MLPTKIRPKSRRKILRRTGYALGTGFLGVLCFLIAKKVEIAKIAGGQPVVQPYEFQMNVYTYRNDTSGQLVLHKTKARRSDGTTVLLENLVLSSGIERKSRKITNPDGVVETLNDSIAAKTTCQLASANALARYKAWLLNPTSNCVGATGETLVGNSKLLGQNIEIIRSTLPSNEIFTRWTAPSLGCLTIQYRFELKQADGTLKLETEGRPVSLQLREPDSDLFNSEATYTELMPSQRLRRLVASEGLPWIQAYQNEAQSLDTAYSAKCQTPAQ